MPTLTVQVTAEDIDNGQRRDDWSCPVCLALWRTSGTKWVVASMTCYPITDRNTFIPLAPAAIEFISTFDQTGCGKPFEFKLEMP